jgi:hypothetical protein
MGGTNYDSSSTLVNGLAQQTFSGVTNRIRISLGEGNDQVEIEDVQHISLEIETGTGDDDISIGKYVAIPIETHNEPTVVISNHLTINSGDGNDTIFLGRVFGRNGDQYRLRIDTEQGDDVVDLYNVSASRFIWNGGTGDDQINIGFTWVPLYWVMKGNEGNDLINIYCSRTASYTLIEGGFGDDTLAMDTIQAHVDIVVSMDTTTSGDTGNGDDSVLLARSVISGIQINVGEGKNNVTIGKYYDYDADDNLVLRNGGCIAERIHFRVDMYTDNTFIMAASDVETLLYFGAGGNDTVDLQNNLFGTLSLSGSYGTNTLIRRNNSISVNASFIEFIEE